jgi:hypothetical protein
MLGSSTWPQQPLPTRLKRFRISSSRLAWVPGNVSDSVRPSYVLDATAVKRLAVKREVTADRSNNARAKE